VVGWQYEDAEAETAGRSAVGWVCGSAGASPSQGVERLEIPVCGAGIGDMQRRGAGGP